MMHLLLPFRGIISHPLSLICARVLNPTQLAGLYLQWANNIRNTEVSGEIDDVGSATRRGPDEIANESNLLDLFQSIKGFPNVCNRHRVEIAPPQRENT